MLYEQTSLFLNYFLNVTPKGSGNNYRNNKLDFIKIKKHFVFWRALSREWKDSLQNERKYLQNHISDMGLLSRMYEELLVLSNKNPIQIIFEKLE